MDRKHEHTTGICQPNSRVMQKCRIILNRINIRCSIGYGKKSPEWRTQKSRARTIMKMYDGFEITFGQFFSTPEFLGLKQELRKKKALSGK